MAPPSGPSAGRRLDRRTVAKAALVLVVLALALDLRLTSVLLTEVVSPLRADAREYFLYAHNLVEHGVYSRADTFAGAVPDGPDFVRPPGFPLFAALLHDADPLAFLVRVTTAQTLANALSVLVLFLAGLRLFGYWPALIAAFFYAISPHVVASNVYFLTESLTATLIVAVIAALAAALATGRTAWWLAAGLLLGYATLTREYLTYFPLLLAPFLLAHFGRRYWPQTAVLLLGFALMLAPWKVAQRGGEGAGQKLVDTIHHGLYPDLMYRGDPRTLAYPYRFDPRNDAIAESLDSVLREARERFTREPLTHVRWFLIGKPLTMWRWGLLQGYRDVWVYPVVNPPYDYLPHFRLTYRISHWSHLPLVVLGLIGCLAVWLPQARRAFPGWPLAMLRVLSLFLLYATAVHMVGAPFPRYHVPQKAPLFLMAVALPVGLMRLRRARS